MPPQSPLVDNNEERSSALSNLLETAVSLQSQKSDSIRILPDSSVPTYNTRHINSLVFCVVEGSSSQYVLAVLSEDDRVNVTKLEEAVVSLLPTIGWDKQKSLLSLAPMNELQNKCGFESGTVPPLGLSPAPILTLVEQSLLLENDDDDDDDSMLLVGGGGLPNQSTLLPVRTLLDLIPNVKTADFRETTNKAKEEEEEEPATIVLSGHHEQEFRLKPYFAVEPPDTNMAEQMLTESHDKSLQPEWLTVVGRISGVRQMARRLVFADLAPPTTTYDEAQGEEENDHPWRSPRATTGKEEEEEDMAVQLILGKSICQRLGDEDGEKALRRLKVGQLIMVQGRTNVENRSSLKNWIRKNSLDIVVFDYQLLQTEKVINVREKELVPKEQKKSMERKLMENISNLPFLQLHDLIEDISLENAVRIVDSPETVASVNEDLSHWLTENPNETGLVGVDCEWKPNFLAASGEAQPVLLLQICFYPLKRIYLLDLQTLLRPLLVPSESMNPLETVVSKVIGELFQAKRLIKVGFQVAHDFQKLAASYPHIKEFQEVHSVLEASQLGMKVMQITKEPGSRLATSSLSKMTERFIGRTLNKEQQVSDWSLRPLIHEQIVYAALDAIVTPVIVENLVQSVGAQFSITPQLGRRENDPAFSKSLTSWRFILLNSTTTDGKAIRKLRGKRFVGDDSFLASQSWVTAEEAPNRPSIRDYDDDAGDDGPYTDLNGIVRVPSHAVSIIDNERRDEIIESMIGERSANTKDRCVSSLLKGCTVTCPEQLPEGWKLDFPQRSGYVELENAVALFVTMPVREGRHGQSRSYPNEWLEDGSILSWFIRDSEWDGGTSRLAKKMMMTSTSSSSTENGTTPIVLLFVRRGKGNFLCCGRCRVVSLNNKSQKENDQHSPKLNWSIVELYLMLIDWKKLQSSEDFQGLVSPIRARGFDLA